MEAADGIPKPESRDSDREGRNRRALGGHDALQLHDEEAPGPTLGESPDTQIVRVVDGGGIASADSPYVELAVSDFLAGLRGPVPEVRRTSTPGQAAHAYAAIIAERFGGTVLTPRPRDLALGDLRLPPGVAG